MTANINPDTGVAYGYISARALDSDLVHELMSHGVNHDYNRAYAEWRKQKAHQLMAADLHINGIAEALERADDYSDEFSDTYEDYEPTVEGVRDGVTYCSSWLGGALNFFIFHSPITTDKAREASPCVPNAGILDTLDGSVTSYDVPAEWRYSED